MEDLRKRAEELLNRVEEQTENLSLEDVKTLVHDLRVHQIELELQNEELRRTQAELQNAMDNYSRLYNDAPAGYLTVDRNGSIFQVNKTFEDMVGIEVRGQGRTSIFDLVHDEDRVEFISRFRPFQNNPEDKNLEIRFKKISGDVFFANLKGRIDRVSMDSKNDGRHNRILIIVTDISHKKEAEEKIRRQKKTLQTILDGIPDITALHTPDGDVISFNKAACEYLELSPANTDVRKCFELIGRNRRCDDCVASMALMTGEPATVEQFVPELERWFQIRAIPIFHNGKNASMIVEQLHDIDHRKRMEIALVESEKKFRNLLENSIQGVLVVKDDPVKIAFASTPVAKITGYEPDELKNFSRDRIMELIHPEDREQFFYKIRTRLAGGNLPPGCEYRIMNKSGDIRWVEVFSTVIDYEGDPAVQKVMLDITERKKSEEEQRRLEQELRHVQKMEAIGTLAGGVAHDFNNLLQAINGYAQVVLMGMDETHPFHSNVQAILNAGWRAADLVRQMLLFSRKIEADRRPLDINAEISQARSLLERTIPKMIDIDVHPGDRLRMVMADPVQFEQVILNLCGNAADAMPEGGRIIIETRNMTVNEDYALETSGVTPGDYVLLAVSDTGCGMDKEVVKHIFEPFYTTKEVGKGTGLGLASVYGIVKSHGGFINCYSEVGLGTVFRIYFPAMEGANENDDDGLAAESFAGGDETILVVDDEEWIRDFVFQVLTKLGYNVLTAGSGEEAFDVYSGRSSEINLVILDIGMPGMGGRKCLTEILKFDPSAKILIASGYSVKGPLDKTLEAGAAGYVEKPYRIQDLLKTVRTVLDEYKDY